MEDVEQRVRDHARRLWEEAGCPEGGSNAYAGRARELVAIEDNQKLATKPPGGDSLGPYGEPVEPEQPVEALGDLPTLTDQGEEQAEPGPRDAEAHARWPLSPPRAVGHASSQRGARGTKP